MRAILRLATEEQAMRLARKEARARKEATEPKAIAAEAEQDRPAQQ
jgi:hypothetical protein